MRERLALALKDIQAAKQKLELCQREENETRSDRALAGMLTSMFDNLRVTEVYLVRAIGRLPPEQGS